MPVGREPVAYPFAPCGHFKLVNLCRFDQDVPWMKARRPFREHHHCVTGRNQDAQPRRSLTSLIHEGLAMILGAPLFVPIAEPRFTDR